MICATTKTQASNWTSEHIKAHIHTLGGGGQLLARGLFLAQRSWKESKWEQFIILTNHSLSHSLLIDVVESLTAPLYIYNFSPFQLQGKKLVQEVVTEQYDA